MRRVLEGVFTRLANMVVRAVVERVDDSTKMQVLQLTLGAGEVSDAVERFQNYGFTSHPQDGAEALALAIGGNQGHTVVLAVDDRRYRVQALEQGEVAVYSDQGDEIRIKRGGHVKVTASTLIEFAAPDARVTGDLLVMGELSVSGESTFNDKVNLNADLEQVGAPFDLVTAGEVKAAQEVTAFNGTGAPITMTGIKGTYNIHTHPAGNPPGNTGGTNNPI